MSLPERAQALYNTWWQFAQWAAGAVNEATGKPYSVADAQVIASEVSRTVGGRWAHYDPPGLSQLFGRARALRNSTDTLSSADDSAPIDASMVTEAPWSRSAADMAALPLWQARVSFTYTNADGEQLQEVTTVQISQVLPSSVGSLRAQVALRVQDQLASPPGTGTPRSGSLESVDSITLLAI